MRNSLTGVFSKRGGGKWVQHKLTYRIKPIEEKKIAFTSKFDVASMHFSINMFQICFENQ